MNLTRPRRTVTICIPPREDDPAGEAHFFSAVVEGRTVVSTTRIEAPKPRAGREVARRVLERKAMNLDLEAIKTAYANDDMRAIIKLASGKDSDIWAAAMTAHFGPTGIHESWCDTEGRPTAEALEKLPRVAWQMTDAKARIPGLVRCVERHTEIDREMLAIHLRMVALTA